ncbi:hypothetical protein SDC9_90522 [bioreactor metagenome]|uniref:Uncharacterized protein n=1 Tax=bioreactor metagenome TaxID=1076179 RepID=A0A644ZSI7_9ZZZZ
MSVTEVRVVHLAAVPGRVIGVLNLICAPGGGDVSKRSFYANYLLSDLCEMKKSPRLTINVCVSCK